MRRFTAIAIAGLFACSAATVARADAPPSKEGVEFFEKNIRPVLVDKCYECHSQAKKKVKGKLRLDSYAAMLKGGESGKPSVVPGDPEKSLLVFSMTYKDKDSGDHDALLMPPPKNGKPKKLPDDVIEKFREWIKMGAPYPQDGAKSEATPAGPKAHWAYVPPTEPAVPQVKQASWVKNPVDSFVLSKLEAQNLHPSNPADKRTLIRRANFDLIGLPPTEQEVQAFQADNSPNAFEKVVDRLLASPRYGERWGRYWLDVARYADTKGYVFQEERRYPYAYTYRDWVIQSFNDDLPYDKFLILQIAADKLDLHGDTKPLAAEGFLTVGRRFLNQIPDIIDDRMDVVCRGTMAMTIGCARCHDHKFDPIPTKDYYSLYSVFANTVDPKETPLIGEPESTPEYEQFKKDLAHKLALWQAYREQKLNEHAAAMRDPQFIANSLLAAQFANTPKGDQYAQAPGVTRYTTERWTSFLGHRASLNDNVFSAWRAYAAVPPEQFAAKADEVTQTLASQTGINVLVARAFADAPKTIEEVAARYGKLLTSFDGDQPRQNPQEESLRLVIRGERSPVYVSAENLEKVLTHKEVNAERKLKQAADAFNATSPASPPHAMSVQDAPRMSEQHVFLRGNQGNWGETVKPHFLTVLSDGNPQSFADGSGRLELARDIASKDNPLTARVMVNRIWLHHFGQGLVRTPSDFGTRSDPPTHPELLDYLALRFVENGWSIKKIHKLIMLSATYQQGSEFDPAVAKRDPDNLLLSHFNRHRLDWEATRDSLLVAAGRLDTTTGGRPVEVMESTRRTVYGFIDRQNLPGLFRAFDFASPDTTSAQRFTTTVPQQALFLMNNPFVVQQAQALLRRPEIAGESDRAKRVIQLYRVLYNRAPTADELTLAATFISGEGAGNDDSIVWKYGYGQYDEVEHRTTSFTAFTHYSNAGWHPGTKFPDPTMNCLLLTAAGGHPGTDRQHAAIRRWVSPIDGVVRIMGTVSHMQAQGDGIRAHIISSRFGELAAWNVFNRKATTDVDNVEVKKGDTIDFLVDCGGGDLCDSFGWAPVIRVASAPVAGNDGPAVWSAEPSFAGPQAQPLNAWVKYAQVLLESNEFVFVD